MAVMNVVQMRVKPGMEGAFVRIHRQDMDSGGLKSGRNFWLIGSGERSFIVAGEWDSAEALADARPEKIANLNRLRPILEDLGGGRGVTEPWSGAVALHLPL